MIAIGIDPGKNTGVAVWDCNQQTFTELKTLNFWDCYDYVLDQWASADRLLVKVEDPRGNRPVFDRGQRGAKRTKIAQNIGGVKKEAGLLIQGFQRFGIPTQGVVPKSKKWSAQMFNRISGWEGQSNEHTRDAGRLVVGMRAMPEHQYQQLLNKEAI